MAKDQKLKIPFITKFSLTVVTAFNDKVSRSNGTINRRLVRLFDFRSPPISRSINSVSSSDFVIDSSRDLWFRFFTPKKTSPSNRIPVIFYFHGGAFVLLGPNTPHYDSYCRRLARKLPAYVISINYRLAPEHRFPSQIDDGFDAVKFIDENHGSVLPSNADLTRCFLAGDSAGGNIAHHVAIRCCRNRFTAVKIVGQISIQPFFGGEERTEAEKKIIGTPLVSVRRTDWFWKAYLPVGCNRDHEAANVGGPNSVGITDLDFPETLVIVGGFDPLKDWGRRYYQWIKLSGKGAMLIEYPNMCHAFYLFSEVPDAGELIQRIKEFVTAEHISYEQSL